MTPFEQRLHAERQARLARFAAAALPKEFKPEPQIGAPPISTDQFREAHEMFERNGLLNNIEVIQRAVLRRFPDVTMADLKSNRRTARVVLPRQIAMFLSRHLTNKSFPEIGRRFGDRDPHHGAVRRS